MALPPWVPADVYKKVVEDHFPTVEVLLETLRKLTVTLRQRKHRACEMQKFEHVPAINREYDLVKEITARLKAAGKNSDYMLEEEARQLIQAVDAADKRRKYDDKIKAIHGRTPTPGTAQLPATGKATAEIQAASWKAVSARGACEQLATPVPQPLLEGATSHSSGSSESASDDGPGKDAQQSASVEHFLAWLRQGTSVAVGKGCTMQPHVGIRARSR